MTYNKPLPQITPEMAPFWSACKEREFRVQHCNACDNYWFPPGPVCRHCWQEDWDWKELSGRGSLHSFVVYHRPYHPGFTDEIPYTVGVVALDEGPRFLASIVAEPDDITCDMRLKVDFDDVTEDVTLPRFVPDL